MPRSYVLTNRRRLDAFVRSGGKIDDVVVGVGILTGKPKYPPGHVGSRSHDSGRRGMVHSRISPDELQRRRYIRQARRQVNVIKDKDLRKKRIKELRAIFKSHGLSTRGLARKVTAGTPVARVAGVIQGKTGAGLGSEYHVRALEQRRTAAEYDLEAITREMIDRGTFTRTLTAFGRNTKTAIRRSFIATGHEDTGKLYRNIQYEVASKSQKKRWQAEQKQLRAESRRYRAMKKAARGRRR